MFWEESHIVYLEDSQYFARPLSLLESIPLASSFFPVMITKHSAGIVPVSGAANQYY